SLNARTLRKLGLTTTIRVGLSYLKSLIVKRKPERTLEDFIVNRFGRVLYSMFFEAYTEKVWGVPCTRIPADWGAQRIKGVSISSLLRHALRRLWPQRASIEQKEVETSLIERFLYPKLGPGQMWEVVRDEVERLGGTVLLNHEVRAVYHDESGVRAVSVVPTAGGERRMAVDVLVSTTDVKHLVAGLEPPPPPRIRSIAGDLPYRDFITVGVLLKGLRNPEEEEGQGIEDNWIYVQEPSVRVGRIQFFKNWSPYMVADRDTEWLGLEYFCNEGDDLWSLGDAEFARMAVDELARIGLARPEDLLDTHVVRYRKTYPAYFGSYREFAVVRDHLDGIANLFLVGRNGMHRYNNQDHSMLTAMLAAERIIAGSQQRSDLWDVNTEQSYHETR
ncbi:MAG: FAD-dependent oxidoreductase, partial [Gammaproteobacteria bacterium]